MSITSGRAVGIDVSKYQTPAEWSTINLHFVFARATIGTLNDWLYDSHIAKARDAKLITGAYHFSYDGVSVASQVKAFLAKAGAVDFFFLDVEGANGFSHAQTREFIDRVHQTGRKVGLYMSRNTFFDAGQDYDWVAQWTATAPTIHWDFWQYGSYNGLDGDVFHGSPTQLRALIADTGGGVIPAPDPTPPQEDPLGPFPISPADKLVSVIPGRNLYLLDLSGVRDTASNVQNAKSPAGYRTGGINYRVVEVPFIGVFELVLVKDIDCSAIEDPPAPPPPTDCSAIQAELDLANARALATAEVLRNQATLLGG